MMRSIVLLVWSYPCSVVIKEDMQKFIRKPVCKLYLFPLYPCVRSQIYVRQREGHLLILFNYCYYEENDGFPSKMFTEVTLLLKIRQALHYREGTPYGVLKHFLHYVENR
jgi:hypothetical protein